MSRYYAPKNFNFWYYFGFLAMFVLVNQLVTGVWLTMNYVPSGDGAFASVEYIMRDVEYGWLMRYLHSTGASFFLRCYLFAYVSRFALRILSRATRTVVVDWHGNIHCFDGRRILRLPAAVGQHVVLGSPSHCVAGWRHSLYRPRPHGMGPWRLSDVRNHTQPILCIACGRLTLGALHLDICTHCCSPSRGFK